MSDYKFETLQLHVGQEQPGKEGLLGVEGVDDAIVRQALRDALGAEAGAAPARPEGRQITYTDLYEWGLSGRPGGVETLQGNRDALCEEIMRASHR